MAVSPAVRLARRGWWPGVAAWVLWALAILGLAVLVWLDQLLRQDARPELVVLTPTAIPPVIGAVSAATVGVVLASRRSRHPVGWLLLALGLSLSAAGVALTYTNYGVARAGAPPAAPLALVGGGHRGHAGRLAAGRDACTQARWPACPGARQSLRSPRARWRAAARLPGSLRRRHHRQRDGDRLPGGPLPPRPRHPTPAVALGG